MDGLDQLLSFALSTVLAVCRQLTEQHGMCFWKILEPRIKPRVYEYEAQMLPLCYAALVPLANLKAGLSAPQKTGSWWGSIFSTDVSKTRNGRRPCLTSMTITKTQEMSMREASWLTSEASLLTSEASLLTSEASREARLQAKLLVPKIC